MFDQSSPRTGGKNPDLCGCEPLHQGSRMRELRSQGVQGQGAEVASVPEIPVSFVSFKKVE